jgi:hypothetical protein
MLDADERVSPELKDEIQDILRKNKDYSGFYFKRLNIFLGRPIYHCGWYEATNLRLFDKEKAHYELDFKYIDDVKVEGRLGVVKHPIIHYTAKNLRQYLKKIDLWSSLNAEDLKTKGLSIHLFNVWWYFLSKPLIIFFFKYILKQGFRDGLQGLLISALSSFTYLSSYIKLYKSLKTKNKKCLRL